MTCRHHTIITAACGLMAAALGGCFTGIESTPRITEHDVRNSGVKAGPEQTLMHDIAAQPPSAWRPGKQWLVDDPGCCISMTHCGSRIPTWRVG